MRVVNLNRDSIHARARSIEGGVGGRALTKNIGDPKDLHSEMPSEFEAESSYGLRHLAGSMAALQWPYMTLIAVYKDRRYNLPTPSIVRCKVGNPSHESQGALPAM